MEHHKGLFSCSLLSFGYESQPADRAALCSSLSLSSALSCPACFLPVVVINFAELYSSKSLEEPFGNGSTPRRLFLMCPNKIRLWFRYCIYNLTWTFCIQPSWSLVCIHIKFGLYTVLQLLPNKYCYSHIVGGKPQLLAFDWRWRQSWKKSQNRIWTCYPLRVLQMTTGYCALMETSK